MKYFDISFPKAELTQSKYFTSDSPYFAGDPNEAQSSMLENQLRSNGVDVPSMERRSTLDRIGDALSVGQYAVMGGARASAQWNKENGGKKFLMPFSREYNDHVSKYFKGAWEGIKAANPFGQGNKKGEASFIDYLDTEGVAPQNKVGRFFTGLAGDVLLDPTTFMTFGAGAVAKGSAKSAAKVAAKEGFEKAVSEAGQGAFKEILEKSGVNASDRMTESFINNIRKTAGVADEIGDGISFGFGKNRIPIVSDATLRKIGDKTIAPYINKILDKTGGTKLADKWDAFRFSTKRREAFKLARENPLEFAKTKALVEMYTPKIIQKYQTFVTNWTNAVKENSEGLDDNLLKSITHLTEHSGTIKQVVKESVDTTREVFSPKAQEMVDWLKTRRDELQKVFDSSEGAKMTEKQINTLNSYKDTLDSILSSASYKYDNMVNLSNAEFLKGKPVEQIQEFLNPLRNKSQAEIQRHLEETGVDNAEKLSYEIRAMFDKKASNPNFGLSSLKHYAGEEMQHSVDSMLGGAPNTPMDAETVSKRARMEDVRSQVELFFKQTGNAQEAGKMAMKYLEGYGIPVEEYKAYVKEMQGARKAGADKWAELQQRGMKNLQMNDVNKSLKKERENLIKQYIVSRMPELKGELNKDFYSVAKTNTQVARMVSSLSQMDNAKILEMIEHEKGRFGDVGEVNTKYFDAVESKRFNADQYKPQLSSALEDIKRQEEMYIKRGFTAEQRSRLMSVLFEKYGVSPNDYYDAVKNTVKGADNLNAERKYFEQFDKKDVDSYIGKDDNMSYDEMKKWNEANKTAEGEYVKFGDNFGEKVPTDVFDVGGAKIYMPVDASPDVKISTLVDGLVKLGRKDGDIKRLLSTLEMYVTEVKGWSEAISERFGNKIVFGKELTKPRSKANNFQNHIKDHVLVHEVGHKLGDSIKGLLYNKENKDDLKWLEAIRKDGTELFKKNRVLGVNKAGEQFVNKQMINEDLAESFVQFMYNGADFQKNYPARYQAMEEAIARLSVPNHRLNQAMDTKNFKFVDSAKSTLAQNVEKLAQKRNELLQNIDGVDVASAEKELTDIDKLAQNEFDNEEFKKLFYELHTDEKLKDVVKESIEKKTNVLDMKNEKVQEFMDNLTPELRAKVQKFIDFDQGSFHEMYEAEKAAKKMYDESGKLIEERVGYQPHMLTKEGKKFDAGAGFESKNKFAQERKIDTTIERFNEWAKGKGSEQNVMEDNAATLLLMRGIYSNHLTWTDSFYRHIVDAVGMKFENVTDIPVGHDVYASSEHIIESLKHLKGDKLEEAVNKMDLPKQFIEAIQTGDAFHSAVKPITKITRDQFLQLKQLNNAFTTFGMNGLAAEHINQIGLMQLNQKKSLVLDLFDKVQTWLKTQMTVNNPGFHFANAKSNVFQNYLNVGAKALDPKLQVMVAKMLSGKDAQYMATRTIKVDGAEYTLNQIVDMAERLGVLGTGQFGDSVSPIKEMLNPLKEVTDKMIGGKGKGIKSALNNVNPFSRKFVMTRIGGAAGQVVENQARLTNFVANLQLGKDFFEAADNTKKFLFDYNDLSETEKNVMKRIVPFYTWMRKNIPLQLEQLGKQPNTYKAYFKTKANVEKAVPEGERLKSSEKNNFADDWWQLPFATKGKSGGKEPTFYNPRLPIADLGKLPLPTKDFAQNTFSSLSPLIKMPIELMANKNVYFNTEISKGIGDRTEAPGYIQLAKGGTKENPVKISPQLRYILRNITSLENISKITDIKNSDSERNMAITKLMSGEGTYSYDVNKFKQWAFKDRLKTLRTIKKAYEEEQRRK